MPPWNFSILVYSKFTKRKNMLYLYIIQFVSVQYVKLDYTVVHLACCNTFTEQLVVINVTGYVLYLT